MFCDSTTTETSGPTGVSGNMVEEDSEQMIAVRRSERPRCIACTHFCHSNTRSLVRSHSGRGWMDGWMRFWAFLLSCGGTDIATGRCPLQGALPHVYETRLINPENWRSCPPLVCSDLEHAW